MPAVITGTGVAVPPNKVTNHDLAKIMDTSDEWIRSRSGVVSRRFVDPGIGASDLATEAGTGFEAFFEGLGRMAARVEWTGDAKFEAQNLRATIASETRFATPPPRCWRWLVFGSSALATAGLLLFLLLFP